MITREVADAIEADESIKEVKIQSVLSTSNLSGIPQKSYGVDRVVFHQQYMAAIAGAAFAVVVMGNLS